MSGLQGQRNWSNCYAGLWQSAIALCIVIDILQYSNVLSFLPQLLKDEGHNSAEIASAIGSYYWAGFLGGACITSYQIKEVMYGATHGMTWSTLASHVMKLVIGLMCGAITLLLEGLYQNLWTHFFCRFAQGFLGAFLFIFSFFLAIELFEDDSQQRILAQTMATMGLHTAEVFGPFIGGAIFTSYGPRMPFYVLSFFSLINQLFLLALWFTLPKDEPLPENQPLLSGNRTANEHGEGQESGRFYSAHSTGALSSPHSVYDEDEQAMRESKGLSELMRILTSPMLWRSILVIAPAAMIKAALEVVLPLFADHKMHYDEFRVGLCFTLVAISFLTTSSILGAIWNRFTHEEHNFIVAGSMMFLGVVASLLLLSFMYGGSCILLIDGGERGVLIDPTPDCSHAKHSAELFYVALVMFGVASAGCFVPSTYIIGNFVQNLSSESSKEAANSIWNTLWEAGGSTGLALAGIPSTRSWLEQELLMLSLGFVLFIAAFTFLWVSRLPGIIKTPRPCGKLS